MSSPPGGGVTAAGGFTPSSAIGSGEAGAEGAGAAAPRPGNLTVLWHFGHLTLKARSGTRASSMTIFCAHCGQLACMRYLSIKSSISDFGGGGALRAPVAGLWASLSGTDATSDE